MSSNYYGAQAGEISDRFTPCGAEQDWPELNAAGVAICSRENGHDGEHRDDVSGVWWHPGEVS